MLLLQIKISLVLLDLMALYKLKSFLSEISDSIMIIVSIYIYNKV